MRGYHIPCLGVFLLLLLVSHPVWAGQVVTDDDRRWAKNALAQEQAIQPAPNTLAVLYFRNRTGQTQLDPLQKGLACMLMTDLAVVENLRLVERARLQALVEELDLGAAGLVERQTAPRVGKLLGASYLVGGDLSAPGADSIGIDANLLQVSDQHSLGQPATQGQLAQIFDLEKKILFDLIELLKIRLTPEQRERLKQPLTRNYQALLLLSSGLEASDRGNYSAAAVRYQQALAHDPQFQPAKNALKELRGLGLVKVNPKSRALLEALAEENSSTLNLGPTIATFRPFRPSPTGQVRVTW